MTKNPNIKKAILQNVLESEGPGDMREVADNLDIELHRVCSHVEDMHCLTYGVSPKFPFCFDKEVAKERLKEYESNQ